MHRPLVRMLPLAMMKTIPLLPLEWASAHHPSYLNQIYSHTHLQGQSLDGLHGVLNPMSRLPLVTVPLEEDLTLVHNHREELNTNTALTI